MEEDNLSGNKNNMQEKSKVYIALAIGIIIGVVLMLLLWYIGIPKFGNETVATTKVGRITKNKLYSEMKKYYPISYVLDLVDKSILDKKYTLTKEQMTEITEEAESYINMYAMYYGYTEEQFLSENGFESKEDFINYLSLDTKRELYYEEYLKTAISQEEINNYYNENVFGEIDTKHILVEAYEEADEENALKIANEIIAKLNKGANFDDVAEEYKDKVVFEQLGYNGFNSGLVQEYIDASKALENNTYSKEPVKTKFGYHIIYRINQAEKPSLEEVEADIISALGEKLEEQDQYLKYRALDKLRQENNLKFKDKNYEQQYKNYCEKLNGLTNEEEQ